MSDLTGELIDSRYQLIRSMATGGMATIYEAIDTRLDRKVAVKIMHPHLANDEEFVGRFIKEAKAAAALSHPNIVNVQDQGWNQGGARAIFLVMELVEGSTLREYLYERGKLTPQEVVTYLLPVSSALAAAHKVGIIHRDIKPENILISKEGRIKIADFGLAKGAVLGATQTLESSIVLGSVSYLSPEQVQRGITDARSDVYSLGITAYELLTGQKPYDAETPIQIAYMHVNERIGHVKSLNSDIPDLLDDLIYRATSPNPDERPRDAGEFYNQLSAIALTMDPKRTQMSLDLDLPVAPIAQKKSRREKKPLVKELTARLQTREVSAQTRLKRKTSARVKRNRSIALALAIALGISIWYLIIGPGSRISVPSVVGGTEQEASAALKPLGLSYTITKREFSEEIPAGKIISSDPEGGRKIDQGGSVKIVLSKGPERYIIPTLSGLTPEAAVAALEKFPLKVGALREVFTAKTPQGYVIDSTPAAGSSVKRDSVIDIRVSKGVEQIQIKDYLGQSGEQALTELTEAGFKVEAIYSYDEKVIAGGVVSQSATATAPKGSRITLVISKGSIYTFVPNIYSLTEAKARALLKDQDLVVVVKATTQKSVRYVTSVVPKPGTKVRRTSTVTITVG